MHAHAHTHRDRQTDMDRDRDRARGRGRDRDRQTRDPPSAPLVGKVGKGEESLEYVVRILLGAPACFGAQFGV